jgi:pimeloyl-ACP methyl ester carboxylesterase
MVEGLEGLSVRLEGEGPPLLLVHGSAADFTTWAVQRAGLAAHARLLLYDRRGAGESPLPPGRELVTVEEHAADAARLIEAHGPGPLVACGSSFGAVVVLELARRRPELLRGMVLLEPPLPPSDSQPLLSPELWESLERTARTQGGPAATEAFLRYVLGDDDVQRMPRLARARVLGRWESIRRDCLALAAYRVNYASLHDVRTPALLLGGERSPPQYAPTLAALGRSLARDRVETVPGMGHMLQADVRGYFNRRVLAFMDEVGAR